MGKNQLTHEEYLKKRATVKGGSNIFYGAGGVAKIKNGINQNRSLEERKAELKARIKSKLI